MTTLKTTLFGAALLALTACVSIYDADTDMELDFESSQTMASASDRVLIEAVVMDYFEGQTAGSFKRLDRAFNDDASMFGVAKNEAGEFYLRVWPKMSEVIEGWSDNPRPNAPERDGEILSIDVVDERIATVMFRSTDRFYDALTLVKIDGQWEIASKVFVRQ